MAILNPRPAFNLETIAECVIRIYVCREIRKSPKLNLFTVAMDPHHSKQYWHENVHLIRNILLIWFVIPFVCGIGLANVLNRFSIGHLPLGFWVVQQGALLVFIGLVFAYAIKMDALDRKYGYPDRKDPDRKD